MDAVLRLGRPAACRPPRSRRGARHSPGPSDRYCSSRLDREPGGTSPEWYEVPPDRDGWRRASGRSHEAGTSWASRVAAAVDGLPAVEAILSRPNRPRCGCATAISTRKLLIDEVGELVVVDWEDLGPAEPARELACTLVACFHDGDPDLASMRRAYRSYVEAGGPARLRATAEFTMLIATPAELPQPPGARRSRPDDFSTRPQVGRARDRRGVAHPADPDVEADVSCLVARLRTDEQLPPPR